MPIAMKDVANAIAAEILRKEFPSLTIAHDPDKDLLQVYDSDGGFIITRKMIDDNEHMAAVGDGWDAMRRRRETNKQRFALLQQSAAQSLMDYPRGWVGRNAQDR